MLDDTEVSKDDIQVKDSFLSDGYAAVVITIDDDNTIIADILNAADGTKYVEIVENEVVPVTDAKKQEIIDIASTDSELKAIFDKGASAYKYYFDYIPSNRLNNDGSGLKDGIGGFNTIGIENRQIICDELTEYNINCWLEFNGNINFFRLDMLSKTLD